MGSKILVKSRSRWPAFVLFLISPYIAELVSGYLTIGQFFEPYRLIITLVPYGCGVLIARELTVRSGKGWASLLMFGIAFGLFFEGIVTRVFVNPNGLYGVHASYGFMYGWHWPSTIGVTHFHAVLAIVVPVFITEMLFPEERTKSWIGTPVLVLCSILLPAWTFVLGFFQPFLPSVPVALSAVVLVGLFMAGGLILPAKIFPWRSQKKVPPFVFGCISALGMFLIMFGSMVVPSMEPPALPRLLYLVGGLIAILTVELFLLVYLSGSPTFGQRHRLAMVIGFLIFFFVINLGDDIRIRTPTGKSLVASLSILGLLLLRKRVGKMETRSDLRETMRDTH